MAANRAVSTKGKFPPPSAFKRRRVAKGSQITKVTYYVRDVLCLPKGWTKDDSRIPIPRGERRSTLAESGLIGKIEFNSNMTDKELRIEICKVFTKPMGLTSLAFDKGELFPFVYLQRTGAGSRTLCVPSVTESFQWNGKQVATLAKSGGVIYILAQESLIMELFDYEVFTA